METYKITYQEPMTRDVKTIRIQLGQYSDAEAIAYRLADKGWYRITRVVKPGEAK